MAIYDPSITLEDALRKGYTRLVLINADADNSINLGLRYRQALGFAPAYNYGTSSLPYDLLLASLAYVLTSINSDLITLSSPNLGLVCNMGPNDSYPCHVTLFIQTTTFEPRIDLQQMAMSWLVSLNPTAVR